MFIISDRVKETTTSTGQGSIVLNGAFGAFQTFSNGIGDGNTTYYTIENNSRWEVGQGVYTASSNSLSRDIVFESSNGGGKISLEGASIVFCTLPASKAFIKDPNRSVYVNNIIASGDANVDGLYTNSITNSGNINVGQDALISGDLNVLGNFNYDGSLTIDNVNVSGDIISSGFLTLVRNGEGNFFHAYKDDGTNQTVSLYVDENVSPLWKLGLKTNPNNQTAEPTFAYVYGRDGLVGLVSNNSNFMYLSDSLGFTVVNDSHLILRASSNTGVYIDAISTTNPALTIQGAPLTIADLQVWENSTGSTLSVVDSGGKFGILNAFPLYELDVDGSGKMDTLTLTSGIYFPDGTFQSTANDGGVSISDINAISGIASYASGLSTQNEIQIVAVSGWAESYVDSQDHSAAAVSGWAASTFITSDDDSIANFASGLAVQNEIDIATVSGLLYDDAAISGYFESRADTNENQIIAVSGWAESYVDSQDHSAVAVSGWAEATFLTQDDDSYVSGVATYASGLATQNVLDIATVSGLLSEAYDDTAISGYFESRVDTNETQIIAVSGWAQNYVDSQDHSAAAVSGWAASTFGTASTSGIGFAISGVSDQYRVGTIFIDEDGAEQTVRTTSISNGYLTLEVANFSPTVSANGQSRYWDQPVTQWSVTVDNPTDFLTNYVSGVSPYLTSIVGSVTSGVELYTTSGPSSTPAGGVDWNQTFTVDGDSPIYSTTSNLTGGSASATVSFLDKNQDTISDTATISFSWQNASNSISFANLSGKNFLESYPSTTYNLTINGISNLANTSTVITSSQGSLSNSSDDGTITFTNPIHKNNNSGRTITATTDFTRPDTVTGTEYTVQDVSSDSSITATFTYPSFYILTSSTGVSPTRADIVDGDDFDSATVTELGNQVKTFEQELTLASAPKAFWFAVRSSASQPTSFQTGASAALLSDTPYTTGVVSLEPDSPAAGYVAEDYKIYGITLASTVTYIKIS